MARVRLRRQARKRREAGERKAQHAQAATLPPPLLELFEGPEPCRHTWGETVRASISGEGLDVEDIRFCEACHGFVA